LNDREKAENAYQEAMRLDPSLHDQFEQEMKQLLMIAETPVWDSEASPQKKQP
jgi:hypothetical protein